MSPRLRVALTIVLALTLSFSPRSAIAAWPNQPGINLPVCTSFREQSNPVTVSDGAGGAIVTWYDFRSGSSYDVYTQHILASGAVDPVWPVNGRAISTASGDQLSPAIASDGAGGAIITWNDSRSVSSYDIYAQHVLASGVVDPAWPVDGRAVCTAANNQNLPQLVSDGAGGAIITWYDARSGSADIYAEHVLASGAVDGGWPANGRPLCTAPNDQQNPTIASDGAGGAIVTWHDLRSGNYDIYAEHVSIAGAVDPAWPADGRALCTATSDQAYPMIVADGAGGAVVSWMDARSGNNDVYAEHVLASGAVDASWPVNGRALCVQPNEQAFPVIVSDGAGGAIVAWNDLRSGATYDIYAQHVLASGGVDSAWPVDGRGVCTATGNQGNPTLLADGAGGAIVAWADGRNAANADVYAQHVQASGAVDPAWPANGRPLSTASGDQQLPVLVSDGTGGAIVTWYDARSGNNDIYAQRVARFGYLGTPEPVIASVKDVANDQGGKVKLSWDASWLDTDVSQVVDHYWIFRSVATTTAEAALRAGAQIRSLSNAARPETSELFATNQGTSTIYWEFVASQAAFHIVSGYSDLASTVSDSTGSYNPATLFMITAWNAAGTQYWSSTAVGGYSVDNLPPDAPSPFTGQYNAGLTRLHWNPNTESDLVSYRLYRGSSVAFVPGPGNRIAAPSDTGYADAAGAPYVYKLTAVDVHGNESHVSTVIPSGTVGVDGAALPAEVSFAAPSPNPAGVTSTFRYALPRAASVRLAVYDAAGRLVRELASGVVDAGEHAQTWDLCDARGLTVGAGLYFARFECDGRTRVRRVAVAR